MVAAFNESVPSLTEYSLCGSKYFEKFEELEKQSKLKIPPFSL